MIVVAAPAPTILVPLARISRSPVAANCSPAPGTTNRYVPAGTLIVEPGLELAVIIAPRRLQSPGAAVQADSAATSAVVSTLSVAAGATTARGAKPARAFGMLPMVALFSFATATTVSLAPAPCDCTTVLKLISVTAPTSKKKIVRKWVRRFDIFIACPLSLVRSETVVMLSRERGLTFQFVRTEY